MIANYDPVLQALFASLFTWGVTALGAALVFVLPSNSKKFLDVSLGFAGGVMTAASFWSLLAPAIEISEAKMGSLAFIPVALGFALGAIFVHLSDNLIPSCVVAEMSIINVLTKECNAVESNVSKKINQRAENPSSRRNLLENDASTSTPSMEMSENINTIVDGVETSRVTQVSTPMLDSVDDNASAHMMSWRRILLLIMAVTVHNIPEGLAVGVGFGSVGKTPAATFEKAFNLALGIGLQNFPEGLAVSLPLAGFGYSKLKAFFYGQLSGMVEPFAALLGAAAVLLMEPVLPYALSFAAGAMIYVVFDDIVPEAQRNGNGKLASTGAIVGFLVMMSMDVPLVKEMILSQSRHAVKRLYAEMDYARHFPKAYVERMKRIVPKKVYGNRYGAPPVIRWTLPPDDYVPPTKRPWEMNTLQAAVHRERKYFLKTSTSKFFQKRKNNIKPIPNEEWAFFPGDMVQVMVGKDKGSKGFISHVIREANAVFVDGMHTKLVTMDQLKNVGMDTMYSFDMEPLYVDNDEVKLIDPNDGEPCTTKWILNPEKTDYIRISERTGYGIPLPAQALVTYEYMTPSDYIEVIGKDTPAKVSLKKTYQPKLCTFEKELEEEYNLKPYGEHKPTYWY